jgi:YD repeat-containing protein
MLRMKFNGLRRCLGAIAIALLAYTGNAHADGPGEPIPSFYQESGLSRNRDYVNQHASEHIDPFTGKVQWHYVDLFVPGNGGMDIKVQRSYSSRNELLNDDASPIGVGWTMHFGRLIQRYGLGPLARCASDNTTKGSIFETPDGGRQQLYPATTGSALTTTSMWRTACSPTDGFVIVSPDGMRYEVNSPGEIFTTTGGARVNTFETYYTTRITDRHGNTLNFDYVTLQSGKAIKTITASDGRVVTFNYNTNGSLQTIVYGDKTWTYSLTGISFTGAEDAPGFFFLNQVTRPDGISWKYEYNPPGEQKPGVGTPGKFSLKKVTYPTGGTISYEYQFVRFNPDETFLPPSTTISRKVADDGTWVYTFRPATAKYPWGTILTISSQGDPPAFLDATTVDGPNQQMVYLHFGHVSVNNTVVNNVVANSVYLIGTRWATILKTGKGSAAIGTQVETFNYDGALLSPQENRRPGPWPVADFFTFIPLLKSRSISRLGAQYIVTYSDFDDYLNPRKIEETNNVSTDKRTTTLTYNVDTAKWIIHQKKNESWTVSGANTPAESGAITREFDANANLLSETSYGVATSYTYTAQGDLASRTDARDNTISYGSYHRGIPRSESHPEGVTISRSVSDDGNVLSETDGIGAVTSYTYDGLNRVKSITHATGNPVSVVWDANSRLVKRNNYSENTTFDGYGRAVRVDYTGGGTITMTHQYDELGRKVFSSYPASSTSNASGTRTTFDVLGRPVLVQHVADSASVSASMSFTYNQNTVNVVNERGKTYSYLYRTFGDPDQRDLIKVTAPDSTANVSMKRNALGQLTEATQTGKTRTYTYNPKYQLESRTDPETGITTFGRDAVGNMTSRKVAASGQTIYTYDNRNRVKSITYPGGPAVTNTYYADDKLRTTSSTGGGNTVNREFFYTANKRLEKETLSITAAGQPPFIATTQYEYDGNDALARLIYGSGKSISYRPDGLGRPTAAFPYVRMVTYHPSGQVASTSYSNNVRTSSALNARLWPETLQIGTANALIMNSKYRYDSIGNVTSIIDGVDTSYNRTLTYDDLDRLADATGSWGSGTISYDGNGNIKTLNLGAANRSFIYDTASGRLNSVSGSRNYTFAYDLYGNVKSNGPQTFNYNDALQMTCFQCGTANQVEYMYDAANMRVSSKKNGVTTYYVYGLGGKLLWETTPGVELKEYIYLNGKQVAVRKTAGN